MRLRIFEARSMAEALQQMRRALGEQAVIIATQELPDRVRLTAAADLVGDDLATLLAPEAASDVRSILRGCLTYHAVPPPLRDELLTACEKLGKGEPAAVLTRVLEQRFSVVPLELPAARPLAMVGPPGSGKTANVVRLAAQARVAGLPVRVASADMARAGSRAQLTELLGPLSLQPEAIDGPDQLRRLVEQMEPGIPLILDTIGINPFRGEEVASLAELLRAARAEPVLVLPAGLDPEDSVELAGNFAAIGAQRMIVSRLDAARRLGGMLAAAELGLAFAGAGIAPAIGRGVSELSALGIARVLLHRAAPPSAGEA